MAKTKRLVTASSIIIAMVLFTAWTYQVVRSKARTTAAEQPRVHPFTALVSQATLLPGNQIPVDTQMKTFAVRSDGSTAELAHRIDPSDIEQTLYIKRITDVPGNRLVVVDPFSESITTYPHEPAAVAYHAAKPVSVCDGKPAGQQLVIQSSKPTRHLVQRTLAVT